MIEGERKSHMVTEVEEPSRIEPNCMVRIGVASWNKPGKNDISVKYAWRDKNGKVTRGGEVPVEALPQMLELAIKSGRLQLKP